MRIFKNKNYINVTLIIISVLCLALIAACSDKTTDDTSLSVTHTPTLQPTATATLEPTPSPTTQPEPIQIILGGTGDIMVHKKQLEDARYTARSEDGYTYYFEHNFKYIASALQYPDLMLGNLETVFAGNVTPYIGYPKFNTPDSFASALKNAGFDVLTNANNHSLDQGKNGLLRTINVLEENGFHHTGTFENLEDYNTPLIIDVNGVNVGVLAGAYGFQHIGGLTDEEQEYMISVSSEEYLKAEVEDLKNAGAQIIVASMHWGDEKSLEINNNQKELAHTLVESGVDVIFGHHPHVLQPIEYMEVTLDDGTTNSAVVCWSLGNFLANSPMRLEQEGAICYVYLIFDPVTEQVTIDKTQVLPTYIFYNRSYLYDFHVLPAGGTVESLAIDDFKIESGFQPKLDAKFSDVVFAITEGYVEFITGVPAK